jgi:hypothetical protein
MNDNSNRYGKSLGIGNENSSHVQKTEVQNEQTHISIQEQPLTTSDQSILD